MSLLLGRVVSVVYFLDCVMLVSFCCVCSSRCHIKLPAKKRKLTLLFCPFIFSMSAPNGMEVFQGFLPSADLVQDKGMLYVGVGIIGATVM